VGLLLAALITQKPFAEKVIAPYILIMVTTPMIALVPFLRLKMGFGSWPLIIAVALASGPMVMLNSATGFRRTDLAKIALARSYGASTFQIFRKIRFPLALPMIIVGFMVGSIFGLLTAVGGEMVAPSEAGGLGERLVYYSSLARMDEFGAVIAIVAALGVGIYVLFYFVGKRWASWEA
jgi:NitT/TauT family transport system permease protein